MLVVRVHPEALKDEKLPPSLVTKNIWEERFEDIRSFERHMARNGTVIRKFFLHLSKKEQKRRFLARLDEPEKNWKFSEADIHERDYWDDYQKAYEDMIRHTASKHAPWYVVPADNKWFTHLVVSAAIVETLEELDLAYPKVDAAKRKEIAGSPPNIVEKMRAAYCGPRALQSALAPHYHSKPFLLTLHSPWGAIRTWLVKTRFCGGKSGKTPSRVVAVSSSYSLALGTG